MKLPLVCGLLLCQATWAQAQDVSVPRKWGLYVLDVSSARVRSLGDCGDWALSPDRRLLVAGDESAKGDYEVRLLSTSTWRAKRLERFHIRAAGGSAFHWSSDSSRVRVTSSRFKEEQEEDKTFVVGRPFPDVRLRARALSDATRKKLRARFPKVNVQEVEFSPDGKRVAAYLGQSDGSKFDDGYWLFRPDGSGLRRLTRNAPDRGDFQDREAVWLDNERLVFRRTSFDDEGI